MPEKQEAREPKTRDDRGRFLPGKSGNPKGRPPNQTATDVLRQHLDYDELAQALLKLMRKGEMSAIAYLYDRLDGRPKQATEISGPDQGPIAMKWDDGEQA